MPGLASGATRDLHALQGSIKRDPEGYADEFELQYRHYKACLDIFNLHPSKDSREFADLVGFVAQVAPCYPKRVDGFVEEVTALLQTHAAILDPSLRRTLVKALILMRNRDQVAAMQVLPVFFKLFECQDKALRQLLFRHIIADIKGSNRKHRNDKLNRAIQNFLYGALQNDNEGAAKRALAVLTELYRRNVWRDARTVNVIASATVHPSARVTLAVLKFFLGQDQKENDGDSDDEDEPPPAAPSREDMYKAKHKGTVSSKKKKQAKLKRVMQTVKKHERRAGMHPAEAFAAMQLLHDPQTFAERLFARLHRGGERFETRLLIIAVVSRAIGVHKLLLLNFYPFLQKYIQPHQRDVTDVLAALVQATHDQVPPDVLAPVMKQLVDGFISDRTRPEAMAVGLKTVRELAARSPLLMTPDLLQDLVGYRKFKNKEVSAAARSLVGLFRELAPGMLAKKDRGRDADLVAAPAEYGATEIRDRIEGAALLQAAEEEGDLDSDADGGSDSDADSSADADSEVDGDGEAAAVQSNAEEGIAEGGPDVNAANLGEEGGGAAPASEEDDAAEGADFEVDAELSDVEAEAEESDEELGSEQEDASVSDGPGVAPSGSGSDGGDGQAGPGEQPRKRALSDTREDANVDEADEDAAAQQPAKRRKGGLVSSDSVTGLKRQLADARARRAAAAAPGEADAAGDAGDTGAQPAAEPVEWGRIFSEEDFERIRELRRKRLVDAAMRKHGLKSASKKARALAAAEEEADETLEFLDSRASLGERHVRGGDLAVHLKQRADKEARLAKVLEGREGREGFGAAAGRKKKKTGGLSNREQQKQKRLPAVSRARQLKRRTAGNPTGSAARRAQRGHQRGGARATAGRRGGGGKRSR